MDTLIASRADVRHRIATLREAMARRGFAAWVTPSSDPHLSEYLPGRWAGRQWLSGFTGSVGTLVVTKAFAGLWVDGRYWQQAESQLAGTGIEMMKIPAAANAAHLDWMAANLAPKSKVGVDGAVMGLSAARELADVLARHGIVLETGEDLLDEVWSDRPALPQETIYEHAARYAPIGRVEKLARVREAMVAHHAQYHFISTLDDIAWLFNLRGSDVSFNPIFVAHALIGPDRATLFLEAAKVTDAMRATLSAAGVDVAPYNAAGAALGAIAPGATLLLDPRRVTLGLRQLVPAGVQVVETTNPSTLFKSRKNDVEAQHVRAAMEQDGAALAEFFSWFESAVGKETITELTIDEKITGARARREGFVSPSFATIAGFNANGAMPHYRATEESHATIAGDGLLLIDSGGQYEFGTTDITRVIPVGTPSAEQCRDYTLVLKGMISLASAQFPRGTRSPLLDALARAPIWAAGVDYGHGTGHGVGYFLNVHEGPQSISPYATPDILTAMEPGMITSDEPGIYRPGKWGVRIENLLLNVPAETTEFGEFLKFETLTLCPIDTRCVVRGMLLASEIAWLDRYHAMVLARVGPLVQGAALDWLKLRTAPL